MQVSVFRRVMTALAVAAVVLVAPAATRAADPIKIGLCMSLDRRSCRRRQERAAGDGDLASRTPMPRAACSAAHRAHLLRRPEQPVAMCRASTPSCSTSTRSISVISAYATNQIAPAMPIVMQRNLVFMALFGTGVNDNFNYDKYFQILPNGKETRLGAVRGLPRDRHDHGAQAADHRASSAPMPNMRRPCSAGARETIKRLGLKIVYDRSYPPTTVDFIADRPRHPGGQSRRGLVASYPPDSVGIVRAAQRGRAQAEDVRRRHDRARLHADQAAARPAAQRHRRLRRLCARADDEIPRRRGLPQALSGEGAGGGHRSAGLLPAALTPMRRCRSSADAITKVGSLDQAKIAQLHPRRPSSPPSWAT